jgi:hypothetical protein
MPSAILRKRLLLVFVILLIIETLGSGNAASASWSINASAGTEASDNWQEAAPVRVIMRSNSDWGRILFDDLNGTNSNGIKIKSVLSSGWLGGRETDYEVYAGRKMAWPDTEYNQSITRHGDMVAFFKGLRDFHDAAAYADLTLEVDLDLSRVYVWLMTGGNGTTTFEIVSRDTGGIIWQDIVVGTGETLQARRVMSPQPFFEAGRAESSIVVAWLSIVILVIIVLNFPVVEAIRNRMRKKANGSDPRRQREQYGVGETAGGGSTDWK